MRVHGMNTESLYNVFRSVAVAKFAMPHLLAVASYAQQHDRIKSFWRKVCAQDLPAACRLQDFATVADNVDMQLYKQLTNDHRHVLRPQLLSAAPELINCVNMEMEGV